MIEHKHSSNSSEKLMSLKGRRYQITFFFFLRFACCVCLVLTALGLCCREWLFSSGGERDCSPAAVLGLLIVGASDVEYRPSPEFSSCGAWA